MAIDYGNLKQSLRNLQVQHRHLLELPPEYPSFIQEGMAESVIQRFETCYDTLWKITRRYLSEALGIAEIPNSPKPIFRLADENQLLASGYEQWETYVETRISTSHDYSQEKAAEAIRIMPDFIDDAIRLYTAMTREPWE